MGEIKMVEREQSQGTLTREGPGTPGTQAKSIRRAGSISRAESPPAAEPPSRIFSIGWAVSERSISENDPRFVCALVAYEERVAQGGDAQSGTVSRVKVLERQ